MIAAAMETVEGSIAVNPYRAGKPLDDPFVGYHSARRGTYRIIHRIDEAKHLVEIHSIRHHLLRLGRLRPGVLHSMLAFPFAPGAAQSLHPPRGKWLDTGAADWGC